MRFISALLFFVFFFVFSSFASADLGRVSVRGQSFGVSKGGVTVFSSDQPAKAPFVLSFQPGSERVSSMKLDIVPRGAVESCSGDGRGGGAGGKWESEESEVEVNDASFAIGIKGCARTICRFSKGNTVTIPSPSSGVVLSEQILCNQPAGFDVILTAANGKRIGATGSWESEESEFQESESQESEFQEEEFEVDAAGQSAPTLMVAGRSFPLVALRKQAVFSSKGPMKRAISASLNDATGVQAVEFFIQARGNPTFCPGSESEESETEVNDASFAIQLKGCVPTICKFTGRGRSIVVSNPQSGSILNQDVICNAPEGFDIFATMVAKSGGKTITHTIQPVFEADLDSAPVSTVERRHKKSVRVNVNVQL
jgi:hypothetical protein